MTTSTLCIFLPWDTHFFGVRIGRVNPHYLTKTSMRDILKWEKSNSIDCLYFLAEFDDPETIRLAEANHFQLEDIRITLESNRSRNEKNIYRVVGNIITRTVQPADISTLEDIARKSHKDTRFYFDRNFSKEKCDSLYATWIRRSCEGWADQVLVAEMNGRAVGYITCKALDESVGQIGLVGVDEQARGQGIGKSLILAALDWFSIHNIHSAQVVTQGRNISAQRLYQKCGFTIHSLQLWYHRWTNRPGDQVG